MSHTKVPDLAASQIANVTDSNLRQFLLAMKANIDAMKGQLGAEHKRPTKQEMIDAGIPNAEQLP